MKTAAIYIQNGKVKINKTEVIQTEEEIDLNDPKAVEKITTLLNEIKESHKEE